MHNKQNFNGYKGEKRSQAILADHFYILNRSVDRDGADLLLEIPYESREESKGYRELGIVQAKFFEKNNEVKIAKEYIEDGINFRTNFFAFIHTDAPDGTERHYFFTASEINKEFKLRTTKKGNDYYVFRTTKTRQYLKFRNRTKLEISRIIRTKILETNEFKMQRILGELDKKYNEAENVTFENPEASFFKSLEGKHIVDKLYTGLSFYSGFRRMIPWRLIKKISFKENIHTSTHYNKFTLRTTHFEILEFFKNLDFEKKLEIKEAKKFEKVVDYPYKINEIINTLNNNLVVNVEDLREHQTYSIAPREREEPETIIDHYLKLNFNAAFKKIIGTSHKADEWRSMSIAYILIMMGNFSQAKSLLLEISEVAKKQRKPILNFVAKYNLRYIAWNTLEERYPNLELVIAKLNITEEKKHLLKTIANRQLHDDYANSIEETYLRIKELKLRAYVYNTTDLVNKLYCTYGEYLNFVEGNYLALNHHSLEYQSLSEKVAEGLLISYSMRENGASQLQSLNSFMIRIMLHQCRAASLLKYLQRNNIHSLKCNDDDDYFKTSLDNFYSKENIKFLKSEIEYVDNRTFNPTFRRKVEGIFENLCVLITYLDLDFSSLNLASSLINFIEKLDFQTHILSRISHILIRKPYLFKKVELHKLLSLFILKEHTNEYLLANCLFALDANNQHFTDEDEKLVDAIILVTIKKPYYGCIDIFPKLITNSQKARLKNLITSELKSNFDHVLYQEAVIANLLEKPEDYIEEYFRFFDEYLNREHHVFSMQLSPYTGIHQRIASKLNNLVLVVANLNDPAIFDHSLIKKVRKFHPYYNFILNLDQEAVSENFQPLWVLENPAHLLLKKMALNKNISDYIKQELKLNHHGELAKIYLKFFKG